MTLGDVAARVRAVLDRESDASAPVEEPEESGDGGVRERFPAVTRRRVLASVLGVGAAKAADNVLLGYGVLWGTNLREQPVPALATERLGPSPFETTVAGSTLSLSAGVLAVDGEGYALDALSPSDGRELDRGSGLADASAGERGPFAELAADWSAIAGADTDVDVRPMERAAFFDTLADADTRPFTVQALRGSEYDPATPETVQRFADVESTGTDDVVDPSDPATVVDGLMRGFNRRTSYDGPRYVAGSVEDNVLMGHGDLRQHFEDPVTFDALLTQRDSGMFCYEFVHRSIDAFHAVAPHRQTPPVFAGVVTDRRHKHAYTALASAYRDDGDLVLPLTFVDYTHSTLYDDVAADVLLGDGVDAYNSRHRATNVYWNGYAVV